MDHLTSEPWWLWRAACDRVVDGDTLDLFIDQGFYSFARVRVRLADIDTAETYGVRKNTEEYARGIEQTAFVEAWMEDAAVGTAWPLLLDTSGGRTGKYGRFLADVARMDTGEWLSDALAEHWPEVRQ